MQEETACDLVRLEPYRRRLHAGDVFVAMPLDGLYLYGRVISTEAQLVGMEGVNLIYVYRVRSDAQAHVPWDQLSVDDLLIPPVLTNRLGWSRGYLKTVDHRPLAPGDVLSQHCFRSSVDECFYDERLNKIPARVEPCGNYGLSSYVSLGIKIALALGLQSVVK